MDARHTFTECLYDKYLKQRKIFLDVTGKKSKMLYETGPELKEKYMEIFGEQEKPVIEAELNAQLAKEFYEKIRSLVNRRERIDIEELKSELLKKKAEKLAEINSGDVLAGEKPELSDVDKAKLDNIYKFMTGALHPALHPDQAEEDKELFDKVVDAYRNRDLEALQNLREVFFKGDDMLTYIKNTLLEETASAEAKVLSDDEAELDGISERRRTGVDFSLAYEIYDLFEPELKDYEYIEMINKTNSLIDEERTEIEEMSNAFPFNAAEMLKSEKKIEAYSEELKVRLKSSKDDYHYYLEKINQAIGGSVNA